MGFIQLTITAIKMFFRDKRALFFSLFLPILFMSIFGIAQFDKAAIVKLGIVDTDKSDTSKQIIEALKNISILNVSEQNPNTIQADLKDGNIDVVLEIPNDLIKANMIPMDIPGLKLPVNVPKPTKPEFDKKELTVFTTQAKAQQAQAAIATLNEIFDKLNFKVTNTQEIFSIKEVSVSDLAFKYLDFLIPGVVALSIMQMALMSIIFTIVGYREKDILKRLQITPIKPFDFIGSQVIARLIISVLQVAVLILIAVVFFHIKIIGSYWLILLLTILGAIVFIAMGISIASVAKTQNTAAPLANIIMMPMMFLGNVFFSIDTMPEVVQKYVNYLPLNYLSDAIRSVMVQGANIGDIKTPIYGLLVWMVLMIALATFAFRWKTVD